MKVFRTNGMKMTEKPNLGGLHYKQKSDGKIFTQNVFEEENRHLRFENQQLKEKLKTTEENHKK